MKIHFEWATNNRLLEREFFERTMALYLMEQKLHTPIPDSMHWTRRFEYPWILGRLTYPTNVLDVGSGATALQFLLSSRVNTYVTSIDPDEAAVDWIKATINTYHKAPFQHRTLVGGLPGLPFGPETFDTTICISVLEHLPKEFVMPSLLEMLRVSKKEVLLTMDICLQAHPRQTDMGDLEQLQKAMGIHPQPMPGPNAMVFHIDGHDFTVACLHFSKD